MKQSVAGWQKEQGDNAQRQQLRRQRPGYHALREIHFYQKSTCFLISMRGFQWFVCEIVQDKVPNGGKYRWQARALFALQQAAESYLVAYLCDTNLVAIVLNDQPSCQDTCNL